MYQVTGKEYDGEFYNPPRVQTLWYSPPALMSIHGARTTCTPDRLCAFPLFTLDLLYLNVSSRHKKRVLYYIKACIIPSYKLAFSPPNHIRPHTLCQPLFSVFEQQQIFGHILLSVRHKNRGK